MLLIIQIPLFCSIFIIKAIYLVKILCPSHFLSFLSPAVAISQRLDLPNDDECPLILHSLLEPRDLRTFYLPSDLDSLFQFLLIVN